MMRGAARIYEKKPRKKVTVKRSHVIYLTAAMAVFLCIGVAYWVVFSRVEKNATIRRPGKSWWLEFERDGKIHAVREDGTETISVGSLPQLAHSRYRGPRISPDGKRWACVSADDGDAEIWVCDADGSNPKKLTDNTAIDNMPEWSPDGLRIALGSTRSGSWQIWIMDADGGNSTQVTRDTRGAWEPRFSPGGDKIAYLSGAPGGRGARSDLMVADVDGKNAKLLVEQESTRRLAWHPEGKSIAYCIIGKIVVVDVPSGRPVRVIELKEVHSQLDLHTAHWPLWKPDGKAIASRITRVGSRARGSVAFGDNELFVVPLEGEAVTIKGSKPAWPIRWVRR